AHPRRPLVRRSAPKTRNAAAVGCSDWLAEFCSNEPAPLDLRSDCLHGIEHRTFEPEVVPKRLRSDSLFVEHRQHQLGSLTIPVVETIPGEKTMLHGGVLACQIAGDQSGRAEGIPGEPVGYQMRLPRLVMVISRSWIAPGARRLAKRATRNITLGWILAALRKRRIPIEPERLPPPAVAPWARRRRQQAGAGDLFSRCRRAPYPRRWLALIHCDSR